MIRIKQIKTLLCVHNKTISLHAISVKFFFLISMHGEMRIANVERGKDTAMFYWGNSKQI